MSAPRTRAGFWLLLAVLAGCIDYLDPQTGSASALRCLDEDGDRNTPVSFAVDIQPIFDMRCRFCHYPTGGSPIGIQTSRLDLSTYQTLRAGGNGGIEFTAGMPCTSLLFEKLGPGPPFGSRMPLNGPPFLDDRQLQLVHDWIAEGALEN